MKKQVALLVLSVLLNVSQVSSQDCGAYVAPGKWKQFMCHNLGAANTAADPFTPGWEIVGGYWQWGRKTMAAAGPTGAAPEFANGGAVSGWNGSYLIMSEDNVRHIGTYAINGSWSDTGKTGKDPCPSGYRIPTNSELDGLFRYNESWVVGNWSDGDSNYSSGRFFGDKLFLPAAGDRSYGNGALDDRGSQGWYWSSTESITEYGMGYAWYLNFSIGGANAGYTYGLRAGGLSVRCIAE
jgi:uncharacterized protein (TIGR02145 family)